MNFKIDNVYSAKDADKLKPGTKAIFGDNMEQLRTFVKKGIGIDTLDSVLDEGHAMRFVSAVTERPYALAHVLYDGLTWKDLKIGDLITNGRYTAMVIEIDYEANDDTHILAGASWISDEELKDWKKV